MPETSAPAADVADVSELLRAMMAMFETLSRVSGMPGLCMCTAFPKPEEGSRTLNVPTSIYSGYFDGRSVHGFFRDLNAYIAEET